MISNLPSPYATSRTMKLFTTATLVVLTLSAVNSPAHAVLLNFTFGGEVTALLDSEGDPTTLLSSQFAVDDRFTLTFSIDTETPDGTPGDASMGSYEGVTGLSFSFTNGYSASDSEPTNLFIFDEFFSTSDQFQVGASTPSGPSVGGFDAVEFFLILLDTSATVFTSDSIPTDLDLGDFNGSQFAVTFEDSGSQQVLVNSEIDSLSVTAIPEPSAFLFGSVVAALVGVCSNTRRRRRCSAA